jgi:hypothetical protein
MLLHTQNTLTHLHTHTYTHTQKHPHTHTDARAHTQLHIWRMQPHTHVRACTCVSVRLCACGPRECVSASLRVSACPRETVRVRERPRACAGVWQRPCGCVGFICVLAWVFVRAFVCVRRSVCARACARARASVHACVRVRVTLCVLPFHRQASSRMCLCVHAYVERLCVRASRLGGRFGGTAGTGGINSSAGGAGRPRVRGCGAARSAGLYASRPQVSRGRAVPSRRNGLREVTTRRWSAPPAPSTSSAASAASAAP